MLCVDVAFATDRGLARADNQDTWGGADAQRTLCATEQAVWAGNLSGPLVLVAVADGVGGLAGGGEASRLVISELLRHFQGWEPPEQGEAEVAREALLAAIAAAHQLLMQRGAAAGHAMSTTLSALLLLDGCAVLGHVGDSRIYRLRAGEFEQLSHDHSHVQHLVDLGVISSAEARQRPDRNVLLAALGFPGPLQPECRSFDLHPGDRFLLCSDGFHASQMAADLSLAAACSVSNKGVEELVADANQRDGSDNITVAVAHVLSCASRDADSINTAVLTSPERL